MLFGKHGMSFAEESVSTIDPARGRIFTCRTSLLWGSRGCDCRVFSTDQWYREMHVRVLAEGSWYKISLQEYRYYCCFDTE